MNNTSHLRCWIYKSPRKTEMYLYLARQDAFEDLPHPLLERFGTPALIMELDLHPGRPLAREDVNQVLRNLQTRGFHLQLPAETRPDLYRGE